MAVVLKNLVTKGLSGKLGDSLVFRKVGDKTIVSTVPTTTKEPTEKQKAQRERFQMAVLYAKSQMDDPATKAAYEAEARGAGQPNAYNIAVADFFRAPDIEDVDLSAYTGAKNDTIRIRAIDDFKVKTVRVEIYNADGTEVENGEAVQQTNGLDWVYTATTVNEDLSGDRIVIKASDIPGNITEQEEALS